MRSYGLLLSDKDREAVRTLMAFLRGRLAEQRTIDWALRTRAHEIVKRSAVLQSLVFLDPNQLKEPWRSAWRMIEESWNQELPQSSDTDVYGIQRRIATGERSGSLISAIVAMVQPRLEVTVRSERSQAAKSKRSRQIEDLFHASLDSPKLADLAEYRIDSVEDVEFLVALGIALEGAVNHGIAVGRRIGWEGDYKFWQLGQLYYVGYLARNEDGHTWDVDKFHQGIAPSVKLLDAVVKRIGALDLRQAKVFISRWKQMPTPIHLRLWASLSKIAALTPPVELVETFLALEDRPFWDANAFPEIAELRALRFGDFPNGAQTKVLARITKEPPSTFWPRTADRLRVKSAQRYWAARELRRIEVAGCRLPDSASNSLANYLVDFPDLRDMNSVQFGFMSSGTPRWVKPETDDRYNDLVGDERLRALETALTSASSSWMDAPADRASNWIRSGNNASLLLPDLEASRDGGAAYPGTWDRFGWSLSAPNRDQDATSEHLQTGDRVLALLELLPTASIEPAIQGITFWISSWERVVTQSPRLQIVWNKLWPIAVAVTNEATDKSDTTSLNQIVGSPPDDEPTDLDTLNTATGRLVGAFLASCPTIHGDENPFETNEPLRVMRDSIVAASGRSGLIGRHRLIEDLPYFLRADEDWSRRNLVAPLLGEEAESLALWRAIARRMQFTKVLEVIGHHFADRAIDRRLGRETRSSLLSSLVLESLHAFRERRIPVIANAKVQQTLRAVDDEVRANAAQTVERFLSLMAGETSVHPRQTADELFRLAVAPFLQNVWPQERSLATRGVSAAFAHLPAASGDAFGEAVGVIERFIVPFDCWSMSDFGLWGESDGTPRLTSINTSEKAMAFLRLLDLSIGNSDGSVVPMDLSEALDQIRQASPALVSYPAYRRLSTIARRR